MFRKAVFGLMPFLILVGMLTLGFIVESVKTEPQAIIVPDGYPTIQGAINAASLGDIVYVRAGIYEEHIVINKSISLIGENPTSTIIDGTETGDVINVVSNNVIISGFTITRSGYDNVGIKVQGVCNITGNVITGNSYGIWLFCSSNNIISRNNITANDEFGIDVYYYSNNNNIFENNITETAYGDGIALESSSNNIISRNNLIANAGCGIKFDHSDNNIIFANKIVGSNVGIGLEGTSNVIIGNNVTASNWHGMEIYFCSDNKIFHNNFVNNTGQVDSYDSMNIWDDGYPSGGNYWSDYNGTDLYCGPFQNKTGSDGVGDAPYTIDLYNLDGFPLVKPWSPPDLAVADVTALKDVVGHGLSVPVNVTVQNFGDKVEAFNLSVYAYAFHDRLEMAVSYIEAQFNSTLSLCREAPAVAPNNYWLVSDNLLAFKALEPYNSTISSAIRSALTAYAGMYNLPVDEDGLPISYAHEAVLGRSVPLPFRAWNTLELAGEGYTLKTVIANGTEMLDWQDYADLLLYASLSEHWQGNETAAAEYFSKAADMWDGMGIFDKVANATGLYETYKLALLLYTSKVIGYRLPFEDELIERIWRQQDMMSGGIITHYRPDGAPVGDTNTETTAMVVIASPTVEVCVEKREILLNYGQTAEVTFTWNTTGLLMGNYTVWAYAEPILGETNIINNICVDGSVQVTVTGDINGDYKVNYWDLFLLARAYGSSSGDSNWNCLADFNSDGKVDYWDLFMLARNYGKNA